MQMELIVYVLGRVAEFRNSTGDDLGCHHMTLSAALL